MRGLLLLAALAPVAPLRLCMVWRGESVLCPSRRRASVRVGAQEREQEAPRALEAAELSEVLRASPRSPWASVGLGEVPRDVREALLERLRAQWYFRVGDVLRLTDDEAAALGLPLRLLGMLRAAVSAEQETKAVEKRGERLSEGGSAGRSAAQERPAAGAAEAERQTEPRTEPRSRKPFGDVILTRKGAGRWSGEYGLKEVDTNPALSQELADFYEAMTTPSFRQVEEPIRPVTAKTYVKFVRMALGWLVHHRPAPRVPLEDLRLCHLVPDASREAAEVAFDYVHWLRSQRSASANAEANILRALIKLCKFLFRDMAKASGAAASPRKAFDHVEVIVELRAMCNAASTRAKTASPVADETKKWIGWVDYLACVDKLRGECGSLTASGEPRTPRAVAQSYQRYLIAAIFASVPDRQRTVRELELGRTLVRLAGEDAAADYGVFAGPGATDGPGAFGASGPPAAPATGTWAIKHSADDYKTGRAYGERPLMVLPPQVSGDIDVFLRDWRHHLRPTDHDYLFCTSRGAPPNEAMVHRLLSRAIYRLSGKKTNPHLLRDSVVTHFRGTDASERELEALAMYMGHSVREQRTTYDKRTKAERVAPAVQLLESLREPGRPPEPKAEN